LLSKRNILSQRIRKNLLTISTIAINLFSSFISSNIVRITKIQKVSSKRKSVKNFRELKSFRRHVEKKIRICNKQLFFALQNIYNILLKKNYLFLFVFQSTQLILQAIQFCLCFLYRVSNAKSFLINSTKLERKNC